MKFHFAVITLLGLADMVSAKTWKKERDYLFAEHKKEQEQCTIQDATDFTQQDGSVMGCIQSVVTNNRRSSSKKSSSTDSTDGCGALRILPVDEECKDDDIPFVISKPCPPPPPPTPCTCETTRIFAVPQTKGFWEHAFLALQMGCTLATGSTDEELARIRQVAIDFEEEEPPTPANRPLMWIGLLRDIDAPNPRESSPDGPWFWIDGCSAYDQDVFATGANEPSNSGGDENLGVIFYEPLGGTQLQAGDIGDADENFHIPAIYECCE